MIVVYHFGYPEPTSPDLSPFCTKLLTWLRMSGIPYDSRTGDVDKVPTRKLPVAEIDGQLIADSSRIIAHLQQHDARALRDEHLDPREQASAAALQAMMETKMYFCTLYLRFCTDADFAKYKPILIDYGRRRVPDWQKPLVPVVAPLLLLQARRRIRFQAWAQGTGRWSLDEIHETAIDGWNALGNFLGERPYLMGDRPSSIDATGFAWVHTLTQQPMGGKIAEHVRRDPRLMGYHDRMREHYWKLDLARLA
ncbi:glutathione S-transferase family protein [Scleromatobacter humisilvae]|uniref:Glutathione S-transferase family protein n=1 Tax=Scleromatobacter humisilvae TaxID=2897159 RepID=A0A9X1YJI8_9BURK|nr:glutathione S-transferase family protein [Scleromatobacter humisilvae]MCK9686035.1 glutathione S-transferase family protein [Scleromatobacter humisilvae]